MQTLPSTRPTWPLFAAFFRWPLILAGGVLVALAYRAPTLAAGMQAAVIWATITVTVVNIINAVFLRWRARVERFGLLAMLGFRRDRLARDVGVGLLLSVALGFVETAGVALAGLVVQLLTGKSLAEQFTPSGDALATGFPLWLAVLVAMVFPIFNATVEELNYRGYAQPRLIQARGSVTAGVLIVSLGFGLQHMGFAFTVYAVPAFVAGFFCWGIVAGWITHRQARLMPVLVAHLVSNLLFAVLPLVFTVTEMA